LTRALRGLLYEVEPGDPTVLAAAAFLLLASSLVAALLPIWRAEKLDAAEVLRGF